MSSPLRWPDAVLAGLACSMRSMSGPAVLAARGQIGGRPQKALLVGAVGELAVDKTPVAPNRTEPPALVGRIGSGAYTGYEIAGPAGSLAAALSAGVGTYSTWRIRKLVVNATGLPDPMIAAGEDVVAYALAAVATRLHPGPRELEQTQEAADAASQPSVVRDAATGLISGIVGTAAMTIAQGAEFVLTPAEPSDVPARVADSLSRRLGFGRIKRRDRAVANQGMHWLYGASWGIPYGLVAARAKTRPEVSGPVFGLAVWVVALGQQPALGVADWPWERSPKSLGSEALYHVVYGAGAGAALRVLRSR
jgi:hypothetical protein